MLPPVRVRQQPGKRHWLGLGLGRGRGQGRPVRRIPGHARKPKHPYPAQVHDIVPELRDADMAGPDRLREDRQKGRHRIVGDRAVVGFGELRLPVIAVERRLDPEPAEPSRNPNAVQDLDLFHQRFLAQVDLPPGIVLELGVEGEIMGQEPAYGLRRVRGAVVALRPSRLAALAGRLAVCQVRQRRPASVMRGLLRRAQHQPQRPAPRVALHRRAEFILQVAGVLALQFRAQAAIRQHQRIQRNARGQRLDVVPAAQHRMRQGVRPLQVRLARAEIGAKPQQPRIDEIAQRRERHPTVLQHGGRDEGFAIRPVRHRPGGDPRGDIQARAQHRVDGAGGDDKDRDQRPPGLRAQFADRGEPRRVGAEPLQVLGREIDAHRRASRQQLVQVAIHQDVVFQHHVVVEIRQRLACRVQHVVGVPPQHAAARQRRQGKCREIVGMRQRFEPLHPQRSAGLIRRDHEMARRRGRPRALRDGGDRRIPQMGAKHGQVSHGG